MPRSPMESLTLVPVADLVLHEAVESSRAEAVLAGVRRSAVLTDPVVAAPGPGGRWLVLDGAHRATALATLGVPVAVIQRMGLHGWSDLAGTGVREQPTARLDAWAHDIRGIEFDDVVAGYPVEGLDDGPGRFPIATVSEAGRELRLTAEDGLQHRLDAMWTLARRYSGHSYVRTHPDDPPVPGTSVRVGWAPIMPDDLAALAVSGQTFPPGISRFVVRDRLLGIRVPLTALYRAAPGGVLDGRIAERLLRRVRRLPVRHYREPVWVVETSQPEFDIRDPDPAAEPPADDLLSGRQSDDPRSGG